MVPIFTDADHRNGLFALLVAVLPLAAGSFSTALFFAAAVALLVEFGPVSSLRLARDTLSAQPALWLLLAFFAVASATNLAGDDPARGLEFAGAYLHFPVAVLLVGWLRKLSPELDFLGFFIWGCRFGVPIAFLIGLWQFANEYPRVEGASINALLYGFLCMLAGTLSVLRVQGDGRAERLFAWTGLVLGTACVLMSFARGIWLLLPVMYLVIAIYLARIRTLSPMHLAAPILAVVLASAMLLTPYGSREWDARIITPLQQVETGALTGTAIQDRLDMLATGWRLFLDHPAIGVGMQNTVAAANEISQLVVGRQTDFTFTHLHNDYLTHAAGGGILLAALFVAMLVLPVWIAARSKRDRMYHTRLYFAAMVSIAYAGAALTNLVFRHDLPQTFFMCALVFIAVSAAQSEAGVDKPTLWPDRDRPAPT